MLAAPALVPLISADSVPFTTRLPVARLSVVAVVAASSVPPESTVTAPASEPIPPSLAPLLTVSAPVPLFTPSTSKVPALTVVVPL